jgi:hypothetical protein
MKIDTPTRDIQSGGLVERKNFTVNAGAHIMAVLSGLYKDPVDAMVREYLTNMYDAVAALKRAKGDAVEILPAVLSLPTSLNPELIFRDFGVGMSCDTVMNVYSQYGNSTKNGANDEVGGFGLGSKTAFCYNNGSTWTIESRFEGMKHVFMASIGESGIPFLAHVSSAATTDHSGVTIRIPIRREHITDCYRAAQKYIPYFTLPLNVEGDERAAKMAKTVEYVVRGKSWGIRKENYNHNPLWRVVMGNVPYDINWYDLRVVGSNSSFYQNQIDLFVPIGSVDIVPSRDALKMTDRTKAAVQTAIGEVISELQVMLSTQIQSAPSYWDALIAFTNLDTIRGARDMIKSVKWQGREVDTTKGVIATMADLRKVDPAAVVTQYGVTDTERSGIVATLYEKDKDELRLRPKHTWLMIEDVTKGIARVKSHLYTNLVRHTTDSLGKHRTARYGHTIGHALVVRTTATTKQLSDLFGGYPESKMIRLSDLAVEKIPASIKSTVDTIYRWNGSSWDARANIPTNKKYYLILEKGQNSRYVWRGAKGTWNASHSTRGLLDYASALGIRADRGDLYGVKADEVSKLDPKMFTDLYEAVQVAAIKDATKNTRSWAVRPTLATAVWNENTLRLMFTMLGTPAGAEFAALRDVLIERESVRTDVDGQRRENTSYLSSDTVKAIAGMLSKETVKDPRILVTQIVKKYPVTAFLVDVLSQKGEQGYLVIDVLKRHTAAALDFWMNPR